MLSGFRTCLEEHQFASDALSDFVSDLDCRNEGSFHSLWCHGIGEVVMEIFEQRQNQIVAIIQIHKQIILLRQKGFHTIRANDHLRIFQSRSQIEVVQVLVVGEEAHAHTILPRHSTFFKGSFYCVSSLLDISTVYCRLADVKAENECGWHRWSIHVLN